MTKSKLKRFILPDLPPSFRRNVIWLRRRVLSTQVDHSDFGEHLLSLRISQIQVQEICWPQRRFIC
jgi:hypothetical protein